MSLISPRDYHNSRGRRSDDDKEREGEAENTKQNRVSSDRGWLGQTNTTSFAVPDIGPWRRSRSKGN
ncbi:hypothetical protein L596_028634 [Steinernema carpocapsae]|uniref:Uncharacterized protein n=1 Tax=Steinernema carpocapsae TaxID=34508 RepID=A0A4U5LZ17_STECR|nr:hypothetical protein L596_028634 [Steinernema carpocapsae]